MSINAIRSPASTAPPPAPGAPEADTKRTPTPGMTGAHRTVLSERAPQQASEASASPPSPRVALAKLGAAAPEHAMGTVPDAAQAFAAKVLSEVDNGKLTLLASHSAASLRAAAGTAARGLMALRNELLPLR